MTLYLPGKAYIAKHLPGLTLLTNCYLHLQAK
ncbi:hypothetical protein SVI_3081 [Shewanella violacea DSS12]|uniref:Uncharacterized protein n=1 Tax=Shewanella violacea (strain JCM 10179 / CIP 106290 / LMG 19151 / DSS12) TaxID=637905 RepID=D4ZAK7_SHEVD|nr:hypothetical protein SVI_3081 [Shewanella violacea DSS12]